MRASTRAIRGNSSIVVANSNGGVGDLPFGVHLAAWHSHQDHRVKLSDSNTRRSSSE